MISHKDASDYARCHLIWYIILAWLGDSNEKYKICNAILKGCKDEKK